MTQNTTHAKLACAYGGAAWGVFWMPLRALDEAGLSGAWATVFFYIVPLGLMLPMLLFRRHRFCADAGRGHLIGITAGLSLVLYSDAFLYTDVIRAMLLFYLTPVWSTLLARVWLKEPITIARLVAIVLGASGFYVLFGIEAGVPLPQNMGDWMGLASGFIWAVAAVLMRRSKRDRLNTTFCVSAYFLWGSLFAVLIALAPITPTVPLKLASIAPTLSWFLPIVIVVVMPAVYAVMWGTPLLSPGVVAILFMTEISVGAVTAAIWAGEPFTERELLGVILITLAGLADTIKVPLKHIYPNTLRILACVKASSRNVLAK